METGDWRLETGRETVHHEGKRKVRHPKPGAGKHAQHGRADSATASDKNERHRLAREGGRSRPPQATKTSAIPRACGWPGGHRPTCGRVVSRRRRCAKLKVGRSSPGEPHPFGVRAASGIPRDAALERETGRRTGLQDGTGSHMDERRRRPSSPPLEGEAALSRKRSKPRLVRPVPRGRDGVRPSSSPPRRQPRPLLAPAISRQRSRSATIQGGQT
jgi:hypothetical protein